MPTLNLKPNHAAINEYYAAQERYAQQNVTRETAVRGAFIPLLEVCARQMHWTLLLEEPLHTQQNRRIVIDGVLVDDFRLPQGYYEAKDILDDLDAEIDKKIAAGYPLDNTLFQNPERAVLYQNGELVMEADLGDKAQLAEILKAFCAYRADNVAEWQVAVADFKTQVRALGQRATHLIQTELQQNPHFHEVFTTFHQHCRDSINPNLSTAAVEEMLVQHLLIERTFRTVFNNPDFTQRNVIAREIANVTQVLMERMPSAGEFLKPLDRFYDTIERTAADLKDFSQKQHFLNTVYEQFFQGFSVDVADTHGIVYTPQPIVSFMVKSVEQILQTEFNRSLADRGVHLIDAFVGTGNFIVHLMREIGDKSKIALMDKYAEELWCNEVLLLPYYIATLNIEHEFYVATERYRPFEGICLVDTFDLAEGRQAELFAPDNTQRVEKQKASPMFVVIGNPPYNIGQVNQNDNNKNRKYPAMDARVRETYTQASNAQNNKALADPYVKSIRWASDRIGKEGIVAVVTNNSFLDDRAFDGMRKHLAQDFTKIYHLNFKGNARTSGERRRKEGGNVFDDAIRVGIGISFFIKKAQPKSEPAEVWLYHVDDYLKAREKQSLLTQFGDYTQVPMKRVTPDARHTWLTEGSRAEFEDFLPMGREEVKKGKAEPVDAIFKTYSLGVVTSRDNWAYNFDARVLTENLSRMMDFYNAEVGRWERRIDRDIIVNDFVDTDKTKIKWSRSLLSKLRNGRLAAFSPEKVRTAHYRPFTKQNLYFDRMMNECVYVMPSIFPTPETEGENRVICVKAPGSNKPFHALMTDILPDCHFTGDSQCFPFYLYDEDGTNRRENITDWALSAFRAHYGDASITKWDIFNYTYGLLHHPGYSEAYQANLRRDLPHLPFAADFWGFANAGAQLAELHVNYEAQPEYPLRLVENRDASPDWRVEKMKLSKDKTQIRYNEWLTLADIPAAAFAYRLGASSALEWVVERYRVKRNDPSGIVNDANRADAERAIVRLIGQVTQVSLETVRVIESLPEL